MNDIKFSSLSPRGGSQTESFEELCCQLARRFCNDDSSFIRYRGAGGDGGIECAVGLAGGALCGWQAKFVFDTDSVIKQASKSLATAISVHPTLTQYIICFPFDPTGKTGRKTRTGNPANSDIKKLTEWMKEKTDSAGSQGRTLQIEIWPASKLTSLLLQYDVSGGLRQYFFSDTVLSRTWMSHHIESILRIAGPRYSPELSLGTSLHGQLAAFARGPVWHLALARIDEAIRKRARAFRRTLQSAGGLGLSPEWPAEEQQCAKELLAHIDTSATLSSELVTAPKQASTKALSELIDEMLAILGPLEGRLMSALEAAHGSGVADSKRFRTFMAEYQCCFPAANLDGVREAIEHYETLKADLASPEVFLGFESFFVLSGAGGSGKTHSITDFASQRAKEGLPTLVVFGHQFSGDPPEWSRLIETLGLPNTLYKDALLDALDAAGEQAGAPTLIFIDAINETIPRSYWDRRLLSFAAECAERSNVRVCVSCRTSYLPVSLPRGMPHPVIEHVGFRGMEAEACGAFCRHYGIRLPTAPVLQPETANPLYLKLMCEAMKARGITDIPTGWASLSPVIKAFLESKEDDLSIAFPSVSKGSAVVCKSLQAIAKRIADSGEGAISWSEAESVTAQLRAGNAVLPIVKWLVEAELLIEDGPGPASQIGAESSVRPAFERLGDFLIASELVRGGDVTDLRTELQTNCGLRSLFASVGEVEVNAGVVQALSVLVPERYRCELPSLLIDDSVRRAVLSHTVRALGWRSPDTLTTDTETMLREAFSIDGWLAMDAALAIAIRPSQLDARWLHQLLDSLPSDVRDAFFSDYLNVSYDNRDTVWRIIQAGLTIKSTSEVDAETGLRWGLVLLWFTAAADRRVKDNSTRAAIRLLTHAAKVVHRLLAIMLFVDDDDVKERLLLTSYAVLLMTRDNEALSTAAEYLLESYARSPDLFANAIIRDLIRCIGELASKLGALKAGRLPGLSTERLANAEWPLAFPDDMQVANWEQSKGSVGFAALSCLNGDFNHYSISCLEPWSNSLPRSQQAAWILKCVIEDLQLGTGACDAYDARMVDLGGGGRSKPPWAERIGKKYQWIAMYRLASRLHDGAAREEVSWEPKTLRQPLILQEERKLDPTCWSCNRPTVTEDVPRWWCAAEVDLASSTGQAFEEWVQNRSEIPSLKRVLQKAERSSRPWVILSTYLRWSDYSEDLGYSDPYRLMSLKVSAYFVRLDQFDRAVAGLDGRNYFGEWLPSGGSWLHAFVGEYPWATPFNTEPDSYCGASDEVRLSDIRLMHASNSIAMEWEYDASSEENRYVLVPAKPLFAIGDLWWNGTDGFARSDGTTVFCDPQLSSGGPPALLAEWDDLLVRMTKCGYRLLWTMRGEKQVIRDDGGVPRSMFCQLAWLDNVGEIVVGDMRYFNTFDECQGFAGDERELKRSYDGGPPRTADAVRGASDT